MKLPHPLQRLLDAFTHEIILGDQLQNVFCNISRGLGM